jgi:hypothetical protein
METNMKTFKQYAKPLNASKASDKLDDGDGMDPVGKGDADIDNDGDVDSSDDYLKNRRKAISKNIKKESYDDVEEDEDEVDEALDMRQRFAAKQTFRKNKSKIAMGKKKAANRIASPEKLKDRARKTARKAVEKQLMKNKDKSELSFSQRQSLEKRVDGKKGMIDRIAKKLLPAIKKAEVEKKRGSKSNGE